MGSDLIPGLPYDIALQCLARVPPRSFAAMRSVCKSWDFLIRDAEFFAARQRAALTRPAICIIRAMPAEETTGAATPGTVAATKHGGGGGAAPRYGLSVYDMAAAKWDHLPPLPGTAGGGLPLFCRCVAMDGKVFVVGGWDPTSYAATKSVFCFDFARGGWRRCADMLTSRSFFACAAATGAIFVAGGHDENKRAMASAEWYDAAADRWHPMGDMAVARDECVATVVSSELIVMSGYGTEEQGEFFESAEAMDTRSGKAGDGRWRMVEKLWAKGVCPIAIAADDTGGLISADQSGEFKRRCGGDEWRRVAAPPAGSPLKVSSCASIPGGDLFVAAMQRDECKLLVLNLRSTNRQWQEIPRCGDDQLVGPVQASCFLEV